MERIFIRDLCDLRAESVLESGGINDLLMTGWSVKSIQQLDDPQKSLLIVLKTEEKQ